ncbi:MAG: DMT family transporter [Saccharofermentanales bacterium]
MKNKNLAGHLMALVSIIIWGATFVSTKVLLEHLHPLEIMIYRFILAYIVLLIAYPRFMRPGPLKEELLFLGAGATGMTIYFIFEIFALQATTASNVTLLISVAPVFTAILAHFMTRDEKFVKSLLLGFVISISGIFLVLFNGAFNLKLNIWGSLLALAAAACTSVYLIILKKIPHSYNQIHLTRKVFFYGILTSLPVAFIFRPVFSPSPLKIPEVWINLIFLAVIASALCFYMWNQALRYIGAVKLSNYVYLLPLVGMVVSVIFLHETVTFFMILGAILIIAGTYISEHGKK